MRVKHLIEELQRLDPEMAVYEGDYYYDVREGIVLSVDVPWTVVIYKTGVNNGQPFIYFDQTGGI